jgi:hypothetical protein
MSEAFAATTKAALVTAVPLAHPRPHTRLSLVRDASDTHVGAVLQQQVGQHWLLLGFFSMKFSKTKVNYSTFDRELLAALSGIRPFQLWTDHKPLLCTLTRVLLPDCSRQQRHLALISEYTTHLMNVPGMSNMVADALSSPSSSVAIAAAALSYAAITDKALFDLRDMALRQILCPEVQSLRSSPELRIATQKVGDLDLLGDAVMGKFQPLVPRDLCRQVFDHLHGAAHPGIRASRRLIVSGYVWKGLSTEVTT